MLPQRKGMLVIKPSWFIGKIKGIFLLPPKGITSCIPLR